jgi:predicted Zn finger-like uncharacterized protein
MIATCPACGKRYRLPDDAVPSEGRSVRCAACGHGWTALPEPPAPIIREPTLPFAPPPLPPPSIPLAATASETRREVFPVDPAEVPTGYRQRPSRPRGPRRWRWLAPLLLVVIAAGALAVVEFAPPATFTPPRLGLPAIDVSGVALPAISLPSISLPAIDLPPLDLTKIPLVGDRLDALVHPLPVPPSPLTITVAGERRHLANGGAVLVLAGRIVNPTGVAQPVRPIEARLINPAGTVAYHWRIAAPVTTLPPHHEVPFESTAANYPADAERLDLAFAR